MDAFLFAIGAILPIVLMVAVGYLLKRLKLIGEELAKGLNRLVFRVLLPCMLFLNVYKIDSLASIDLGYVLFATVITVILFLVGIPLCMLVTKQNDQRGPLLQSVFRSNFALVGIALATSLFGEEGGAIATVLSAFSIPLYNILAVICLTVFGGGGKISIKKILLGIVKNPLIWSIAAGLFCLAIRSILVKNGIAFRLSDIGPIYWVIEQLSKTATPIALLVLGAQFELSAIPAMKKQILFGTAMRLVVAPTVALLSAFLIGSFSGAHYAAFVALFASPVAVSSVPMAQEMGADAKLAGQLVVWTTVGSAFTLFLISFLLKAVGIFV